MLLKKTAFYNRFTQKKQFFYYINKMRLVIKIVGLKDNCDGTDKNRKVIHLTKT